MRLWHWELIGALPRQQLLAQWRECCLIAKNLRDNGTPNHVLVNPILDYPIEHFITYARMVFDEMDNRDYNVHSMAFTQYFDRPFVSFVTVDKLFKDWHNDRYFWQCYYNLQEKHDRGGITEEEWYKIAGVVMMHERYS